MEEITAEKLERLYHGEGKTQKEVAETIGCSRSHIYHKMKEYDIQTRSTGPARKDISERFWSKVDRGNDEDCWEWQASTRSSGYGQIWVPDKEGPVGAHVVSYRLEYGGVPEGKQVNHTCDNPPCVNPNHLYAGDKKDNMEDLLRRGTSEQVELGIEQVKDIKRKSDTVEWETIAEQYDISSKTVEYIESGEIWDFVSVQGGEE
jgi:DNA-binding XRE family transcriptional regulator